MKKLAIVTTHPIQYNAPWFKLLTERANLAVKVFYTWEQSSTGPKFDPDFGKTIAWDIPLLEGYEFEFVENVSQAPGSHHFKGIDNPKLNKIIENFKPDAVLIFGWSYKSHLSCMRHFKKKIPVLFRGDSTLLDETGGIKTLVRRLFLTWVYRHIDKALFVGTNNKKYFIKHGLKEKQLIPAYHAIDNERFAAKNPEVDNKVNLIREQLHISHTDFVVLFTGKMESKKNPLFLLTLAKELQQRGFVFLFVGNGVLENQIKEASSTDTRIKFLPFQNQTAMPAIYAVSNVFVLPSMGPGETWGLAANEAMAAGLPVLLSQKCGGAIDLVKDNGLIFNPADTSVVAGYLQAISNDRVLYQKAKTASQQQVTKFNFTQIAKAVEMAAGL